MARGASRTAATSKMERFVIIVNDWKPLTIITKRSILDVAAVLDPPLIALDCFAQYESSKCFKFNSKYLYLSTKLEDVFLNV